MPSWTTAAGGSSPRRQTITSSTSKQEFNGRHLRIPASALRAGENAVTLDFVSNIAPSGASIIRVKDPDGGTYLYTLLVPSDANQLFPCFDQPDLKARLSLSLTWPEGWTALANGSLARADTAGNRITGTFTETKPLPTYLIAFAAGPWVTRTSTEQGRTIHLYLRRSRAREADADTLLHLQHRALRWMEQYMGSAVPIREVRLPPCTGFPVRRHGASRRGDVQRGSLHLPGAPDPAPEAGPVQCHPPRDRPPVVRRPGHHALVRRPLAQGRLRDLHGREGAERAGAHERGLEDLLPVATNRPRTAWTRPREPLRSGSGWTTSTRPRAPTAPSCTTRRPACSSSSISRWEIPLSRRGCAAS